MAYRWGIQNCCIPYDSFPVSTSFTDGLALLNSGIVTAGNTYYLITVTFDTPQAFYKPDGTTYTPHCWKMIYDSPASMSTVEVTDWTFQAPGSYLHPHEDCAAITANRLFKITNYPNVYGTQPCCPTFTYTFYPNVVVNCCDPTERYIIDQNFTFWTQMVNLGVSNYTEAFRASLKLLASNPHGGSLKTQFKCWHLDYDPNPVGVRVIQVQHQTTTTVPVPLILFPSCADLYNYAGFPVRSGGCCDSNGQPIVINNDPCCSPNECDSDIMANLNDKITNFKLIKDNIFSPLLSDDVYYSSSEAGGYIKKKRKKRKKEGGIEPEDGGGGEEFPIDNGGGKGDTSCCGWCVSGRDGSPPDGCYDWMCSECE